MSTAGPAAPKGLGRLFVPDDTTSTRRDDSRDAQVRDLASRVGPSAGPVTLKNLQIVKGATDPTPVEIAHLLGRTPQGYRVVRSSGAVSFAQQTPDHPDRFLKLTSSDVAGSVAGDVLADFDVEVW